VADILLSPKGMKSEATKDNVTYAVFQQTLDGSWSFQTDTGHLNTVTWPCSLPPLKNK